MKLLKIITPLMLVNLSAIWLIIEGDILNDHLAPLGIMFGLIVLVIGVVFDFFFSVWYSKDTGRLWLFEGIFILIAVFIFHAIVVSSRE